MNLLFIDGEVVEAATETIANEEVITIADDSAAVAEGKIQKSGRGLL